MMARRFIAQKSILKIKMAEEKVYTPDWSLPDTPFPMEGEADLSASQKTRGETYGPKTIKDQGFPTKRVAVELIGLALNTKSRKILAEFEFTEHGAIQIGKYTHGVSGDLRITPNGITARDKAGITTFAIDGATGNAVFKGTVQAGTLISGVVVVGNNRVIIDGENRRIIINDGTDDRILIGYQQDGF